MWTQKGTEQLSNKYLHLVEGCRYVQYQVCCVWTHSSVMGGVRHKWYWYEIVLYRKPNKGAWGLFQGIRAEQQLKLCERRNLLCCTTEQVKERRKEYPPTPNNLSLYAVCILLLNDSSCSDVPAESFPIIVHTTSITLVNTTTPHHPTTQNLMPLSYCNKLYRLHLAPFSHPLCISQSLHHSLTPVSSCFPWNHCFVYPLQSFMGCAMVLGFYAATTADNGELRVKAWGCFFRGIVGKVISRHGLSTGRWVYVVWAMGLGNSPAVRVWTAWTGWFGSWPVQKPGLLSCGGPDPDLYQSTSRFRQDWLNLSLSISGSALQVSHSWLHSDMLLLITNDWH